MPNVYDQVPADDDASSGPNIYDKIPDEDTVAAATPTNPRHVMLDDLDINKPRATDPVRDNLHAMASGAYHNFIGGYKGINTLIATRDPNRAADAVNEETGKTYQAPESGLKSVLESKYNPLNYAQELGDYGADKAADYGLSPAVSAELKSLPTALSAAMGMTGPRIATSLRAPRSTEAASVGDDIAKNATQPNPQSISAAHVAPDVSVAHPALREAIENTPNPHPVALERHLDAAQLPLPEGTGPLELRKGQATDNAQQRSDEKNLRADPDTQGILTNSIEDQNKKLGLSMLEIRRRASPDILGRTNVDHDQAAINAIKQQDNATTLDKRAKYKALADANGGDLPIDTSAVLSDINARLKKQTLGPLVGDHKVLSAIMDSMKSGDPIDFETFENWRTRLAEVERKGSSEGAAASIIHDALNKMPLTPEAAPLRDLADTARRAAYQQFETKKRNPAYKTAVEDNVPKTEDGLHDLTADSPLAGNFLNRFATGDGGNASPALLKRLKAAVPDPDLSRAIEAATLNNLSESAGISKFGEGNFATDRYRKALSAIEPKKQLLLSPESIEHTDRLKRVAGYVNDESKADSTNRSNTMVALSRFGAIVPQIADKAPSIGGDLAHTAAGLVAHQVPGGGILHAVGNTVLKGRAAAKAKAAADAAEQSVKDAKLKFAIDATKPGAGLDDVPPRTPRASGGRVPDVDALVDRLVARWRAAKRETDAGTKPLLHVPDEAIVKALAVAKAAV
jgi:hypothetical protein